MHLHIVIIMINIAKNNLLILLQILGEKLCQLINHVLGLTLTCLFLVATIVEVAVRGIWYDKQLLVLWVGIWLANKLITIGFAIHHIVISSLTKVA